MSDGRPGPLEKRQLDLLELLREVDNRLAETKALFFKLREVSNDILNAAQANGMDVIEEIDALMRETPKRRAKTQISNQEEVTDEQQAIAIKYAAEKAAERVSEGKSAAPTHKRACSNCGEPGHRATTCPHPSKNANVGMGKRACSICRKPGHRATTCPEKGN